MMKGIDFTPKLDMPDFKLPVFCLTGKSAIITGSTKGLGYGMALTLAAYGAKVVISSRNQEDCRQAARVIAQATGQETLAIACDVTDNYQIQNLVDKTIETFGGLDIMVANAGIGRTNAALNLTEEEWDDVIDVNLRGLFFSCQYAAGPMVKQGRGGRIITISSAGGVVGAKGVASYCASKAGVINLTRALALEWGRYGITVNAVCPGYVPTDINKEQLENPKIRTAIENLTAFRRLGTVEEIAAPVLFLASDAASFITGHALLSDGGASAN